MDKFQDLEESWWNWKPLAAFVYLLICMVDFIIMPVLTFKLNSNTAETILAMSPGEFQIEMTRLITLTSWEPVTLAGGGLFHLSFGAILTGVAVTRGITHTAMAKGKHDGK